MKPAVPNIRPQTTLWKTQAHIKVRMCDMPTDHLLASINWQIEHRGHKHNKLDKLITEAYRRLGEGAVNKIPENHPWIAPTLERLRSEALDGLSDAQKDKILDSLHEIKVVPENIPTQDCNNCSGTMVQIVGGKKESWTCLNCGYIKTSE